MADQDAGSRPEVDLSPKGRDMLRHMWTPGHSVRRHGHETVLALLAHIDFLERELAANKLVVALVKRCRSARAGDELRSASEELTDALRALDSSSAGEGEADRG